MEIFLILKGTAMVIGAVASLVTAAAVLWPKKTGRMTRTLDRLSPIAPGAIYRALETNGNGKAPGAKP